MITFDKSEYLASTVSDRTLRMVALFHGIEVKDKLLYGAETMTEFLEIMHAMLSDGLTWSTGIAIILGLLKLHEGRKKAKLRAIDAQKLDLILKTLHIQGSAPAGSNVPTLGAANVDYSPLLRWSLSPVVSVMTYIHWRNYWMKFNKAQLLPILSIIVGFIKESTGYEVGPEYVDLAANIVIMLIIPGIGLVMRWKNDHLSKAEKQYMEG